MRIVMVRWNDATGGARHGWRPLKEMDGHEVGTWAMGRVVHEDVNTITVCPHWTDDGDGDGEITIPKGCVVATFEIPPSVYGL